MFADALSSVNVAVRGGWGGKCVRIDDVVRKLEALLENRMFKNLR